MSVFLIYSDKKQSSSFRLIEKETGKETEDTSLSFEDKRLPAYISLISKPTNNSSKDGSKQGTSIDQNKGKFNTVFSFHINLYVVICVFITLSPDSLIVVGFGILHHNYYAPRIERSWGG